MKINLHIERLVFNGIAVEPHQRSELKMAVESELRQQLVSKGVCYTVHSSNHRHFVNGGSISAENIRKSESFGQQIGKAVIGGIAK